MPEIYIRNYDPDDTEPLWEIFHSAIRRVCIRDYTEVQVKVWAGDEPDMSHWREKMAAIDPFVAVIENQPVGYADLQRDGLIDHFYVHADFQRQGVGAVLMNALFSSANDHAIRKLFSHVSITARPFFQHQGFTIVKEQQVMIGDCTFTNFLMEFAI